MNGLIDDDDDDITMSKKQQSTESNTPVLDNFSRDLTKLAELGKLDPVVGRDDEIKRISQILSRRKKNNPILIGEPGCGKTAIIEGLALKIVKGDCPKNLVDKRVVNLDLTSVVAGTKYRGQFEERMKVIVDELQSNSNIIVFIDEIHTLIGSGNSSGAMDGSNILKPALARGEIQLIGATTLNEYKKHIEKDGALDRRFQKIIVDPTNIEETITILKNVKDKYENHHNVQYSDEVIELCVKLSDRYINNREFPDKAFDVLDELGSKLQSDIKIPEYIEELVKQANDLKQQKISVVKQQNYELAAEIRDKEKKLLKKLTSEKTKFEEKITQNKKIVKPEDVYAVISLMTKIPVSKLDINQLNLLSKIDDRLTSVVIGQDDAVNKVLKSLKRNRLGIRDPNRPIGSFIFLGSTGVGKTYLAKQIAKELFGNEESLIRIDMSEYQEKFNVSRLIGAPPGYVGYDEGGTLTEKVKNRPYSVILFDEIEKAHKDVYNILLQILDDGHITDSFGRKIDFRNTLIIITTNLGAKKYVEFGNGIGFNNTDSKDNHKKMLLSELKKFFTPEFLNRIDETIIFNPLTPNNINTITKIELDKTINRVSDLNYKIRYSNDVIDFLSKVGYDEKNGSRPLKRAIYSHVEDLIADKILDGEILVDVEYELIVDSDKLTIKKIGES